MSPMFEAMSWMRRVTRVTPDESIRDSFHLSNDSVAGATPSVLELIAENPTSKPNRMDRAVGSRKRLEIINDAGSRHSHRRTNGLYPTKPPKAVSDHARHSGISAVSAPWHDKD